MVDKKEIERVYGKEHTDGSIVSLVVGPAMDKEGEEVIKSQLPFDSYTDECFNKFRADEENRLMKESMSNGGKKLDETLSADLRTSGGMYLMRMEYLQIGAKKGKVIKYR